MWQAILLDELLNWPFGSVSLWICQLLTRRCDILVRYHIIKRDGTVFLNPESCLASSAQSEWLAVPGEIVVERKTFQFTTFSFLKLAERV